MESQRGVSRWRDRGQSVRGQGLQSVHQHVISHCHGVVTLYGNGAGIGRNIIQKCSHCSTWNSTVNRKILQCALWYLTRGINNNALATH